MLYRWANDPNVRNNAFNMDEIQYDKHKTWFKNKLEDTCSVIYIVQHEKKPVGQIRLDTDKGIGLIDYSVDKNYRGLGIGTQILNDIENVITRDNMFVKRLVGLVKIENIASQKIFTQAGYQSKPLQNYYKFEKIIVE